MSDVTVHSQCPCTNPRCRKWLSWTYQNHRFRRLFKLCWTLTNNNHIRRNEVKLSFQDSTSSNHNNTMQVLQNLSLDLKAKLTTITCRQMSDSLKQEFLSALPTMPTPLETNAPLKKRADINSYRTGLQITLKVWNRSGQLVAVKMMYKGNDAPARPLKPRVWSFGPKHLQSCESISSAKDAQLALGLKGKWISVFVS